MLTINKKILLFTISLSLNIIANAQPDNVNHKELAKNLFAFSKRHPIISGIALLTARSMTKRVYNSIYDTIYGPYALFNQANVVLNTTQSTNPIYKDLIIFYKNNTTSLNTDNIDFFLAKHTNQSITSLLSLLEQTESSLAQEINSKKITIGSSGSIATDIIFNILFFPFMAAEALTPEPKIIQEMRNEKKLIAIIIKQLKNIQAKRIGEENEIICDSTMTIYHNNNKQFTTAEITILINDNSKLTIDTLVTILKAKKEELLNQINTLKKSKWSAYRMIFTNLNFSLSYYLDDVISYINEKIVAIDSIIQSIKTLPLLSQRDYPIDE